MKWTLVAAVALLAASAFGADSASGPACTVSNGVITTTGVDVTQVHCIRRSDVASLAFPSASAFSFGQLALAPSVTLTYYTASDCTGQPTATATCTVLPDTTCAIGSDGIIRVRNIAPSVPCVGRRDILTEFAVAQSGVATFPTPTAECNVELALFADAACTVFVQSLTDIYCNCQGGASPAPPFASAAPFSCYVSNGVVTVRGIDSAAQCLRRSDVATLAFPTSTSFTFGQLAQASPLTLTTYASGDCTGAALASTTCTELPPTTCTINADSTLHVSGVAPNILCVGRGDLPAERAVPTSGGTVDFPTPTAECSIQLGLFSDAACTIFVQSDVDVFCTCGNPEPSAEPTTIATPGPTVCSVSNGLIYVTGVDSSVQCLRRSDVPTLAFPSSPAFAFGQLEVASPVTLTLYATPDCTGPASSVAVCTELPPTTCALGKDGMVTINSVGPSVQCVGRGDLTTEFAAPSGGSVTFPTAATECNIEIHLFSDAGCSFPVQTAVEVFCNCPPPGAH